MVNHETHGRHENILTRIARIFANRILIREIREIRVSLFHQPSPAQHYLFISMVNQSFSIHPIHPDLR
jgi:hypothetical protein